MAKQAELITTTTTEPGRTVLVGRYEVVRCLGSGAAGIVYEAIDRQDGSRLAVKTLRNVEATTIYRLKNEFRALADVTHPSLVQLFELVSDGTQWFLTMELVAGARDLVSYVRGGVTASAGTQTTTVSIEFPIERGGDREADLSRQEVRAPASPTRESPVYADLTRLRDSFAQLTRGLLTLHDAGVLHRDIKPSNVLVDEAGRLTIVDFGIAIEADRRLYDGGDPIYAVGTLAYMAPEQARGEPVTPAADWYAVGVMLYEALTARLPFDGPPFFMLSSKQRSRPRFPREIDVPSDLAALCTELMDPAPEARPSGEDVLRRLGAVPASDDRMRRSVRSETSPFVGRKTALGVLGEALAQAQSGHPASVVVRGRSGIGKTALVQKFLGSIDATVPEWSNDVRPPLILTARCYARESVPFKAFDGIVDALSRFLMQSWESGAPMLTPADAAALGRMFPVLCRTPVFADKSSGVADEVAAEGGDATQLRQRAFGALAELLGQLARQCTVIVFIDDVQWGDADSAALLTEVLGGPSPPSILLVMSHRSESLDHGPALSALLAAVERHVESRWTIDLVELEQEEAGELALALLGTGANLEDELATTIVREAGGSPFFLHQLAQHARTPRTKDPIRLETVLGERLQALPPPALSLLRAIAIAGRPLPVETMCNAAELAPPEQTRALAILQTARLTRVSGAADSPLVEPYHDRIGEAAAASLDPEQLLHLHATLVGELERTMPGDFELLYLHSLGGGLRDKAVRYAEAAAESSVSKLAFDRAVHFYRKAIELLPPSAAQLTQLWIALGKALVDGGRSAESAEAYLAAAERSPPPHHIELKRKAGEQLIGCGHLDRGKQLIKEALEQAGFKVASTPLRAVMALLILRIWLRLRGLRIKVRTEGEVPPSELARLDTCSSVAVAMSVVDPLQAFLFHSRSLLLALSIGEPWRLARALTLEASFMSSSRGGFRRAMTLLGRARELGARVQREDTRAMLEAVAGMIHHFNGQWDRALVHYAHARTLYERARITSSRWERDNVEHYEITTAVYRGKLRFAMDRQPKSLRDAQDRGDLYLSTILQVSEANLVWLFRDDPRTARDALDGALERWGQRGFHSPHWWAMLARTYVSLYEGEGERALRDFDATWPDAVRSRTPSLVQLARVTANYRRGCASLGAAVECRASGARSLDRIKIADRCGSLVIKEGTAYGLGFGLLVVAGAAHLRKDAPKAARALEGAVKAFDASDNELWSAVARLRLGEVIGGDRGKELAWSAKEWMIKEGVRHPGRLAASLAPGFDR